MATLEELKALLGLGGSEQAVDPVEAPMPLPSQSVEPTGMDKIKALLGIGESDGIPMPAPETPIPLGTQRPMRLEGGYKPEATLQEPNKDPVSTGALRMPTEDPMGLPKQTASSLRDYETEYQTDKSSFGNKLKEALIGGFSGFGGRGIGEITNARMIRENAGQRDAKMLNLRSPDSQISGHFRELARMYSDPKEFTVTDKMSADDINEALPWLARKAGLDQSQIGLDLRSRLASRPSGSGVGRKKPLGEKAEELIGDQSNVIEYAGELTNKIMANPDVIGKATSSYQKGLSKIPLLNLNDPDWIELEGQLKAFTKSYLKSMEGGRPSDFDAVSYERITGNQFNSPEELVRLISNLRNSAEKARAWRLESAGRNNKDVSGYTDMMRGQGKSSSQNGLPNTTRYQMKGKVYNIPKSLESKFLKDNPGAKKL
jgi:hypothetical protein